MAKSCTLNCFLKYIKILLPCGNKIVFEAYTPRFLVTIKSISYFILKYSKEQIARIVINHFKKCKQTATLLLLR